LECGQINIIDKEWMGYFGEKMYQVLSSFTKSRMIWIIFGGNSLPNPYAQEIL
jgi:hypothetical protein